MVKKNKVGKIDLNKLTFVELKEKVRELQEDVDKSAYKKVGVWKVGEKYFIRTVTMYLMGRLVAVEDKELVLEECSWISETGGFSDFLQGKIPSNAEVEPFPKTQVIVGRGSIVDACVWGHALLRVRK